MRYAQYSKEGNNVFFDYYYPTSNTIGTGFGLFNIVTQNRTGRVVTAEVNTNTVNNLTFMGNISSNVYYSDGTPVQPKEKTSNDKHHIASFEFLSVGGFAGKVLMENAQLNLKNVSFNDFYLQGARDAAGLVGHVDLSSSNGKVTITDCFSNGLKVDAGLYAAGCIEKIVNGQLVVDGFDLEFESIKNYKHKDDGWDCNGASGIVAVVSGNNNPMTFKNITIGDQSVPSYIGFTGDGTQYGNNNVETIMAGGFIGDTRSKSPIVIENCTAYNLNVYGHRAAAFVGHILPGANTSLTIYNCHVYNTLGDPQ